MHYSIEKHPNVHMGHQYALDIINKKIPACIYTIGAARRYFKDLEKGFYIFDADRAERYLKLTQLFDHVKGKDWKTKNITYEPWQCFVFMNIMGWVDPRTNARRFRVAHAEIPRGQGKSLLASQAVLYFLALDDPRGNEISCAATKKEQARIVLDSARAMARSNRKYLEATGVEVLAHKIVHDKSNSFVRALSSDHDSLDGLNDVLCVMDELHAVSRELFDVIYSGMKKRRDSLMLCITTAGFNTDSVGHSQSVYAKKLLTGDIEDDTFFAIIYTIDEGDDLLDPKAWMKANPNFGVSVDPIVFEATAKKAMITPSDLPNFKVKNLNIWISEAQAFFDLAKWDKLADKSLDIGQFYGEKCYVGIDLASKIDLTCLAYVFKKDGIYYIFERSYVPQKRVEEINNVLYDECVHRGQLIATKGEAIHYPHIQEEFKKDIKNFDIIAAHYDPWCATQFAQELCRERVDMVEFRMTTGNLSEPTKTLDALIREGKIRHNGSPIMRWCVGNVVCKEDANGNIFPRKSHEDLKIDIAVAIIMAIAGWIQNDNNNSVYEDQGIRILGL